MYSEAWDIIYCFIERRTRALDHLMPVDSEANIGLEPQSAAIAVSEVTVVTESEQPLKKPVNLALETNQELLAALKECHGKLVNLISENEARSIVVALIIQSDEIVLKNPSLDSRERWFKLQQQLLKVSDGGNQFFRYLERLMASPAKNKFSLQVFYLCLKQGFAGEYIDRKVELEKIIFRLAELIESTLHYTPVDKIVNTSSAVSDESQFDNRREDRFIDFSRHTPITYLKTNKDKVGKGLSITEYLRRRIGV
ncbi:DotU family type IV/VI secretion system protein [Aliikangiella coralliicola]|uniref:Type IV / VI secretion system DotU domain-containing protein n=1 Tax=Aliikangiella coralliicola TaxID=2592383 RepID=A0A545UGD4_9GAMM|nr:DotU family type IV/VI secretion system protein [Aliikangiella coralliicola]TQV88495.1 hypothetical protein FLL46_08195 [Aliikangiella coralliicola]